MNRQLTIFAFLAFFHQAAFATDDKYIELDSYQFERKNNVIKQPTKTPNKKPELADFSSYNDFLNAMYVYKKNQEAVITPSIIINLPSPQKIPPSTLLLNLIWI
jgi:hypothetical protein